MNIVYSNKKNDLYNFYEAYSLSDTELKQNCSEVKNYLIDYEETQAHKEELKQIQSETGFQANEYLLVDLQNLEQLSKRDLEDWKIGEALAHVFLEKNCNVRFYWNQRRDTKNPNANLAGADLVGFIEIEKGKVLFLFGEVKTSNENRYPPQIMTSTNSSITKQLSDLYFDVNKRFFLIQYLANKTRYLNQNDPFKKDYSEALRNYYDANIANNYHLIGVLVRHDVETKEDDLKTVYEELKKQIQKCGLQLIALYLEISIDEFKKLIENTSENEHK